MQLVAGPSLPRLADLWLRILCRYAMSFIDELKFFCSFWLLKVMEFLFRAARAFRKTTGDTSYCYIIKFDFVSVFWNTSQNAFPRCRLLVLYSDTCCIRATLPPGPVYAAGAVGNESTRGLITHSLSNWKDTPSDWQIIEKTKNRWRKPITHSMSLERTKVLLSS